jgi:hypothetical protein
MLVTQPKSKILRKIIQSPTGEYVLATFVVAEFQGTFKARLVSVEALPQSDFEKPVAVSLPLPKKQPVVISTLVSFVERIVSPFQELLFFVSQPTRAPSLI